MGKTLKEIVTSGEFIHGIELVTTRGLLQVEGEKTSRFAQELMDADIFDFISITDNPGGNPMMAPESLGKLLMSKGHNVNIHISCRIHRQTRQEMLQSLPPRRRLFVDIFFPLTHHVRPE